MTSKKPLDILKQGVSVWNKWREEHPESPDLSAADLGGINLRQANLRYAYLGDADLRRANLSEAYLRGAQLNFAKLGGADLSGAGLVLANFSYADLSDADFSDATIALTIFANNDLSVVKGLGSVHHQGPSTVGIDTIYRSRGQIPEAFLRGVGLPDEFIIQIPSLVASVGPIQFHSCFISYSHRDEEFAKRLHQAMRSENLRVWYAPEEMKGGKKLHDQIFQAIQVHDRLLLVLSEDSIHSEWVTTEIRRARKIECEQKCRKLFPIRLVPFETIEKWECFDAYSAKDLALEVREYYIPDFSTWRDHNCFEREFARLLDALKAEQ